MSPTTPRSPRRLLPLPVRMEILPRRRRASRSRKIPRSPKGLRSPRVRRGRKTRLERAKRSNAQAAGVPTCRFHLTLSLSFGINTQIDIHLRTSVELAHRLGVALMALELRIDFIVHV